MNFKRLFRFSVICFVFISGCIQAPEAGYCNDTSWHYIFEGDSSYNKAYEGLNISESSVTGKVSYVACPDGATALMRCTPYKLDGTSIYTGSKNLKSYEGYNVEVVGKKYSFELEGVQLTEIWPLKIRCIQK